MGLGFRVGVLILAIGCSLGALGGSHAAEYEIKAEFLVNFAKFTEWPGEVPGPLDLCVFGRDPFGASLSRAAERSRPRGQVIRVLRVDEIEELSGCKLAYISSSEAARLPEVLRTLRRASVLSVGEAPEFTRLGGVIRFLVEEEHVRFEVNLEAAKRAGLRIDARMLQIAKVR